MSTKSYLGTRTFYTAVLSIFCTSVMANDWYEVLSDSTAWADLNLRYESVDQDNALRDASALTLRTRIGFKTGNLNGFSFTGEVEDSRIVLGQGDYSLAPTGYNVGEYSVIADPETTELDQAFLQYTSDKVTVKAGRQVITLDNHRFVGHVGWRQDRQTFDGITARYALNDNVSLFYGYLNQRNRIFAQDADIDAKDHLFNVSVKTDVGQFTAYGYLLEVDNNTSNGLDTYGIRYNGNMTFDTAKWHYGAEFATQTSESSNQDATLEYDANYINAYVGVSISGITTKLNYELLGSDDGQYGFATPLATLHKFNGWTDQFLTTPQQGLQDIEVSLSGTLSGGKWMLAYHDFSADEASTQIDDLGSEIDAQYTTKIMDKMTLGVKYGRYLAGDTNVDTNKLWVWLAARF